MLYSIGGCIGLRLEGQNLTAPRTCSLTRLCCATTCLSLKREDSTASASQRMGFPTFAPHPQATTKAKSIRVSCRAKLIKAFILLWAKSSCPSEPQEAITNHSRR